jgi:hypothetical protein
LEYIKEEIIIIYNYTKENLLLDGGMIMLVYDLDGTVIKFKLKKKEIIILLMIV